MLTIRFNRVGRRNKAYFRIVVQEHSVAPGGRHVAVVGSYDPHTKKAVLKKEEILKWLQNGAQPSDTVHNLLVKHQVIVGQKKRRKGPLPKPPKEEEKPQDDSAESGEKSAEDEKVEGEEKSEVESENAVEGENAEKAEGKGEETAEEEKKE